MGANNKPPHTIMRDSIMQRGADAQKRLQGTTGKDNFQGRAFQTKRQVLANDWKKNKNGGDK